MFRLESYVGIFHLTKYQCLKTNNSVGFLFFIFMNSTSKHDYVKVIKLGPRLDNHV